MNKRFGTFRRYLWPAFGIILLLVLLALADGRFINLWLTRDQQGQYLMNSGQYDRAADVFTDPLKKGAALYRAGRFEDAAAVFARSDTAAGYYNRGNALVFQGKYREAEEAFGRALTLKPGWREAEENREIARLKAESLEFEGGDMTGGRLAPDDIVVDDGPPKQNDQKDNTVDLTGGPPLDDRELQALWLRRLKTNPADFLKVKFAYQSARDQTGETDQ